MPGARALPAPAFGITDDPRLHPSPRALVQQVSDGDGQPLGAGRWDRGDFRDLPGRHIQEDHQRARIREPQISE